MAIDRASRWLLWGLIVVVLVLSAIAGVVLWQFGQRRAGPGTSPPAGSEAADSAAAGSAPDAGAGLPEAVSRVIEASRGTPYFAGVPRTVGVKDRVEVLNNDWVYAVGFSDTKRVPLWVGYTLPARETLFDTKRARAAKFAADTRTAASVRHEDYNGSGYDRGHMAPSSTIGLWYGAEAQMKTFLTSNIAPQKHEVNDGDWGGLEAVEERVLAPKFGQVWVMAGPVFEGTVATIGPGIAVPTAFYRIVVRVDEQGPHALAVVVPQEDRGIHTLGEFVTTVREVERRTGLDFMPELPTDVQDRIETSAAGAEWGLDLKLDDNRIRARARDGAK